MTAVTDRVHARARLGLHALLAWAFQEVSEAAEDYRDQFDEEHPAQPWLDASATDDAPTLVMGRHKDTGNQAFCWLTSDGHEVICELVWSVNPVEAL